MRPVIDRELLEWGRKRMEASENGSHKAEVAGSQATAPAWAIKEDERARREDGADQAEGYHYLWSLIIAAVTALIAFAWRLVT